jgi:hypothetical protein
MQVLYISNTGIFKEKTVLFLLGAYVLNVDALTLNSSGMFFEGVREKKQFSLYMYITPIHV